MANKAFLKHVVTLMTGSTIAQVIPIALTPILTRIYTPEDFGVLALFVAMTAILSSIANGRYELAIMLPKRDEDAINIAALGLYIALVLSLLLLLPAIFLNKYLTALLGNESIGPWLYFVPFVVLMMGGYNVLNYLNTRKQCYKDIAKSQIYKATVAATLQVGIGFVKAGATGLMSGQIISQLFANYRLAKNTKEHYDLSKISRIGMKEQARRYIDFPKFSMWAVLANSLAYNLTNIMISSFFSVATLGFYSLAQRLLGMPAALVGRSIGQVYFHEATKEKQQTGKAIKTFNSTSKYLFLLCALMFLPLYFLLPMLFEVVFGKEWRVAGEYGQITLPFVAMQFIAAALSVTNSVFEKQRISLLWQIGLLVLSLSILLYAWMQKIEFELFLMAYSYLISVYYVFLYLILKNVAKGNV